ncbi:MAG: RidA family protein [Leptothrix sp. (in: b-proteobacteria)]
MVQRFDVGPRLSDMAVHAGVVYLAGQVPDDPHGDIAMQTAQVLNHIDHLLARVGTDKRHLLMVQIFLADLSDLYGMNQVWDAWVPEGEAPPRATVQAKLTQPGWKIEIVATAALPDPVSEEDEDDNRWASP